MDKKKTRLLPSLKDLFHNDELLKTLQANGISQEFLSIRIEELIQGFLINDREILLTKAFEKIDRLKISLKKVKKT